MMQGLLQGGNPVPVPHERSNGKHSQCIAVAKARACIVHAASFVSRAPYLDQCGRLISALVSHRPTLQHAKAELHQQYEACPKHRPCGF